MVNRTRYTETAETELKKAIDRQSIAWNDERVAARGNKKRTLYASDYGQCLRKQWFGFFPDLYPTEFDPRVLRIFHNGEVVHERLASYLEREHSLGFVEEVDVPRDALNVHGRCDGISTVDCQARVVEFKSINRKVVREPKEEEHVGQLTWYMMMWKMLRKDLKEDFGYPEGAIISEHDLKGVIALSGRTLDDLEHYERWVLFTQGEISGELIYESKQTQSTFHFIVDYDEDRAKKVRLWFEQLDWHVKNDTLPVVHYDRSRFPCQWSTGRCAYYDECWK